MLCFEIELCSEKALNSTVFELFVDTRVSDIGGVSISADSDVVDPWFWSQSDRNMLFYIRLGWHQSAKPNRFRVIGRARYSGIGYRRSVGICRFRRSRTLILVSIRPQYAILYSTCVDIKPLNPTDFELSADRDTRVSVGADTGRFRAKFKNPARCRSRAQKVVYSREIWAPYLLTWRRKTQCLKILLRTTTTTTTTRRTIMLNRL